MRISDLVPIWSQEQEVRLARNGREAFDGDHVPVVRLLEPASGAEWLLTAASPRNPMLFWGMADLGVAGPEEGLIDFLEIARVRGPAGTGVVLDETFDPIGRPLSAFVDAARRRFRTPKA